MMAKSHANDSGDAASKLELFHLIGSSTSVPDISGKKYVKLEIFEAHSTDTDTIEYCSTFSSTSNADLSVSIQVTNDAAHLRSVPLDESRRLGVLPRHRRRRYWLRSIC